MAPTTDSPVSTRLLRDFWYLIRRARQRKVGQFALYALVAEVYSLDDTLDIQDLVGEVESGIEAHVEPLTGSNEDSEGAIDESPSLLPRTSRHARRKGSEIPETPTPRRTTRAVDAITSSTPPAKRTRTAGAAEAHVEFDTSSDKDSEGVIDKGPSPLPRISRRVHHKGREIPETPTPRRTTRARTASAAPATTPTPDRLRNRTIAYTLTPGRKRERGSDVPSTPTPQRKRHRGSSHS